MRTTTLLLVPCILALSFKSTPVSPRSILHYRISDTIPVRATGQIDLFALDGTNRRLYGAGSYVLDIDSLKVALILHDSIASGAFAIAKEYGRGLTRRGVIFDLHTGAVINRVEGAGDAVVYDSGTGRAFLLSDTVSVVDMRSATLVKQVSVPGAGESGVSDGSGRIFMTLGRHSALAILDARSLQTLGEYSTAPGRRPEGLAIDRMQHRLFSACDTLLVILDSKTGNVVNTIRMPGKADQDAFDSASRLIFLPGGAGAGLTIVQEETADRYQIVQRLTDRRSMGVRAVVDEKTHRVFMPYKDSAGLINVAVLEPDR